MRALAAAVLFLAACSVPNSDVAVGKPAPPVSVERLLNAPEETPRGPLDFGGEPVVLEFWATWCGPCLAWIPHLNRVEAKYDGKVRFLSVTDEPEGAIRRFLKDTPIKGWVGLDPGRALFKAYKVVSRPTTVLLDGQGRVAAVTRPWAVDEALLDALVKGAPVKAPRPSEADADDRRLQAWLSGLVGGDGPVPSAELRISSPAIKKSGGIYFSPLARGWTDDELSDILSDAYGVRSRFVDIPKALGSRRYDAVEYLPGMPEERGRAAFEAFLTARLGLAVKKLKRSVPGYTLSAPAARLKEAKPGSQSWYTAMGAKSDEFEGSNVHVSDFVWALEMVTSKPVIDRTGLKKGYSFKLKWDRGKPGGLEAAVREQLGLALTAGPVVVDAIEVRRDR